ncbi:MAG TPA: hypothetical protein VFQ23_24000 [Anaerolineales bacterium]|nr:hypothetical protein [Anaerolineales bacterium]
MNTVYEDDELGQDTLSIMDTLQTLDPLTYMPSRAANYPDSEFGLALKQTTILNNRTHAESHERFGRWARSIPRGHV